MITKTDAIVLRSRKYRETSRLLNLYTREFGKISVIAKGARGPRNKFGSSLQPLSYVGAVLYKHDHHDLHLLSQCDTIIQFRRLAEDLDKFAAAMSVVEMVEYVAHDEERNDQLFDLALSVLEAINDAEKNAINIQYFFDLHLSDVLGFKPNFHVCLSCNDPLDEDSLGTKGGELRLMSGGVLCAKCSKGVGSRGAISIGAVRILQRLQRETDPSATTQLRLSESQGQELKTTLLHHLQSHVGGLNRLKARLVASSIV